MPSFTVHCPHCNHPMLAEEDWIGAEAECTACGKDLVVQRAAPEPAAVAATHAGADEPPPVAPPPPGPVPEKQPLRLAKAARSPVVGHAPATESPAIHGGAKVLSITSLALGILACCCFGLLAGLPAIVCGHIAQKRNRAAGCGAGIALTGTILGYVGTALTLMLLGTFLPALTIARAKARQINCTANLKQIQSAKTQWFAKPGPATPTMDDLVKAKRLKTAFSCPQDGNYVPGPQDEDPGCSVHGMLAQVEARLRCGSAAPSTNLAVPGRTINFEAEGFSIALPSADWAPLDKQKLAEGGAIYGMKREHPEIWVMITAGNQPFLDPKARIATVVQNNLRAKDKNLTISEEYAQTIGPYKGEHFCALARLDNLDIAYECWVSPRDGREFEIVVWGGKRQAGRVNLAYLEILHNLTFTAPQPHLRSDSAPPMAASVKPESTAGSTPEIGLQTFAERGFQIRVPAPWIKLNAEQVNPGSCFAVYRGSPEAVLLIMADAAPVASDDLSAQADVVPVLVQNQQQLTPDVVFSQTTALRQGTVDGVAFSGEATVKGQRVHWEYWVAARERRTFIFLLSGKPADAAALQQMLRDMLINLEFLPFPPMPEPAPNTPDSQEPARLATGWQLLRDKTIADTTKRANTEITIEDAAKALAIAYPAPITQGTEEEAQNEIQAALTAAVEKKLGPGSLDAIRDDLTRSLVPWKLGDTVEMADGRGGSIKGRILRLNAQSLRIGDRNLNAVDYTDEIRAHVDDTFRAEYIKKQTAKAKAQYDAKVADLTADIGPALSEAIRRKRGYTLLNGHWLNDKQVNAAVASQRSQLVLQRALDYQKAELPGKGLSYIGGTWQPTPSTTAAATPGAAGPQAVGTLSMPAIRQPSPTPSFSAEKGRRVRAQMEAEAARQRDAMQEIDRKAMERLRQNRN